jgi:AraC-like DNA-binding protein
MSSSSSPPGQHSVSGVSEHGVVRVASLLGAPALLRERGVDPVAVLADLGMDRGTFDDPDNRIHYRTAAVFVQRCADAAACPHFGLLLGRQTTLLSLGTLGDLMQRSPTVQVALRSLVLHMHLQTRGGVPTLRVEGAGAMLGYAVYLRDVPAPRQAYDLALAYEFKILRDLCGPDWSPDEVSFSYARPKDTRPYQQFYKVPLRFDADNSEIVFKRAWLDRALPGHDVDLHRALQRDHARQLVLAPGDCAEQVRRALRTSVPSGHGSEIETAELLSMAVRTLRRQLAVQGTTFRQLLEDVRYEIARQLLAGSQLSATEIAEVLAYANVSAFTRSFRRWTGSPPAAWRAQSRPT